MALAITTRTETKTERDVGVPAEELEVPSFGMSSMGKVVTERAGNTLECATWSDSANRRLKLTSRWLLRGLKYFAKLTSLCLVLTRRVERMVMICNEVVDRDPV